MIIYKQEQKDGLSEIIKTQASVVFEAPIKITETPKKDVIDTSLASILAIENPNQIDLFYLDAILVSTGWNKNDDVFDKAETWASRSTATDKPFNFMHDGNDIIGHITGSIAISHDGSIIPSDAELEDVPENFDILVSSVIYRNWPEDERREEIQELIDEINEGKWYVSMECLFPNFDYAVIDGEGNQHVLARSEATAFLTKHLRAYGGDGVYQDYKIGRLLRNFTFSGKGLVDKPANPRSIIFNNSMVFNGSEASVKMFSETEGKITMSDDKNLQSKIDELEDKLAKALEANIQMQTKANEEVKQSYEDKIAELEAEIATIKADLSTKETTVAELQKTVEESAQTIASKESELTSIKAEMVKTARANKLTQAGVAEDKLEETLAKYAAASDDIFDELVALHTEAKKTKETAKMDEEKCSKADENPEEDQAAASTPETVEVVDNPEDKALATAGEKVEDATLDVISAAKASLIQKVFKTTKKNSK